MRWLAAFAGLAAASVFAVAWFEDGAQLHQRRNMLSGLDAVCKLYAGDHDGATPPDLRAVFPVYVNSASYLAYAVNEVEYFPGATDKSNPDTVLLREKHADARGRRWVGHLDCSVELQTPPHP